MTIVCQEIIRLTRIPGPTSILADIVRHLFAVPAIAALGLPFYGASRILASAFYALHDTRTPVKAATLCLGVNIVLNIVLMYPLKIGGIALASSISSVVNTWMLWNTLKKKLDRSP